VTSRRLLLVHAHPDDETINNGVTMARYVAEGAQVTLVTCTRGEQGEVIPPELAHLVADRDDALGPYRVGELAAAMKELGVTDHRFLGEGCVRYDGSPLTYRDSGMTFDADGVIVLPDDARPDAFARADLDEPATWLADLVGELQPQVVVTYEPGGGYGHPDHVQAYRVATRAVELAAAREAAGEPGGWQVSKVYWCAIPEGLVRRTAAAMADNPDHPFARWVEGGMPSMVMADELVTTSIDGAGYLDCKTAALRAHATQISVDGPFFALSNGIDQPLAAREFYRLAQGDVAGPRDDEGRESDLFAGCAD
jgi:N-acetyl-1-D-myo-inositol-2-amino-2-deoxy-alpha-D-glucopyranoside deacetylase